MDMPWPEATKARFKEFQRELWLDHENDPPPELYHYTREDGFRGIITSRVLRVFDIGRLNDPTEGRYSMDVFRRLVARKSVPAKVVDAFRRSDTLFGVSEFWYQYVACFSQEKNSEHQWKKYAGVGKGFCLGIDSASLFESAPGNYAWLKILYNKAEQEGKANSTIDHVINTARELDVPKRHLVDFWLSGRGAQSLMLSALHIKDPGQDSDKEREWRVLMLRPDRDGAKTAGEFGNHYLELPLTSDLLRRVVLGPNCEMSLEAAESFLREHGFTQTIAERGLLRADGATSV